LMKIRNSTNDGWVSLYNLDGSSLGPGKVTFGATEVVFNDAGNNVDFRIEGDNEANLFFVDASADAIGIGTATPSSTLHSVGTTILGTGTYPTGSIGLSDARTAILSSSENQILIIGNTNTTVGANKGAEIILGAKATTGSENLASAKIGGFKANGTSGNFESYLSFSTSNSAGTSSEKARLDSSGRLLVGTPTNNQESTLVLQGSSSGSADRPMLRMSIDGTPTGVNSTLAQINVQNSSGSDGATVSFKSDGAWTNGSSHPTRIEFATAPSGSAATTERMRIKSDGNINTFTSGVSAITAGTSSGAGTTNYVFVGVYNRTGTDTGGSEAIRIYSNGNIQNINNSYGPLSDVKLKENIVDASSQWTDVKALRVVNFNFKPETGYETHRQLGFIAQEVEQVSPGLVYDTTDRDEDGNDLGTTTKVLQTSVLYTKAVKALQEAMERIETLEAKVAALEAS